MDQEDRERQITLDHLTLIHLPDLLVDSFAALRWEARGTPDILVVDSTGAVITEDIDDRHPREVAWRS